MKNFSDIKKEYGLCLRWLNGGGDEAGNTWDYTIWLENVIDPKKERYNICESDGAVLNQKAFDFICEKTLNGFRDKNCIECYDNYIELFKIMGIPELKGGLKVVLKEKGISVAELTRKIGTSRSMISDIVNGKNQFRNASVENCIKMAKALDMTVEELYDAIYFRRK